MTAADHLAAAEAILGQPQQLFDGTPAPTSDSELQLAQVHLLAAIAIELGVPVIPGTHDKQVTT